MNQPAPVSYSDDWKTFIDQAAGLAARKLEELKSGCSLSGEMTDCRFHQVMDALWRVGANSLQTRFPDQNKMAREYYLERITPLLRESVFWNRCSTKPRGYAGDYLMMDMIYCNQPLPSGGTEPFSTHLDRWFLNTPSAQACRHRHEWLAGKLTSSCANGVRRIASLACGPCRELATFLDRQGELRHPIEGDLFDFDAEALDYTHTLLKPRLGNQARFEFYQVNLLKAVYRSKCISPTCRNKLACRSECINPSGQYDLIYCSGFADYLGNTAFRRLLKSIHQSLAPGGILLLAQFLDRPDHPDRHALLWNMDWSLVYRTEEEIRAVFSQTPFGNQVQIEAEPLGLIAFCEARRRQ